MPVIDTDTEEGKAALQKLIDADTKGLKDKVAELLGDKKKLKGDLDSIQSQIDEINRAKEEAEATAAAKSGDVDKIKEALTKQHNKELETERLKSSGLQTQLNQVLLDKGLAEALAQANVAPHHMKAVTALIKLENKGEIVLEEGMPVAKFNGKTIKDFVTEWSQGDEGKNYVAAPNNGGGGANGSNGGGKASTVKSDFAGTPSERQAAIKKQFPDLQ